LLALASGSSLDRHSNNVTLFNLVEQVNFPKERQPRPGALLPLEIHAYFELEPEDVNRRFEVRYALVATTGLETITDVFSHRSTTPRYRTRTLGLPTPPTAGSYALCVDVREAGTESWSRQASRWPLLVTEVEPRPEVTH